MNSECSGITAADMSDFVVIGDSLTSLETSESADTSPAHHILPKDFNLTQPLVVDETPAKSDEATEIAHSSSSASRENVEKSINNSASPALISDVISMRRSSDSSSESIVSASPDETVDEWSRSVVVSHVPEEFKMIVEMALEFKPIGGGKITNTIYSKEERKMLCTFEDATVANHFLNKGHVSLQDELFQVTKPVLITEGFESLLYVSNSSSCALSLLGRDKLFPVFMSGSSDFESGKSDKNKCQSDVTESQAADPESSDSADKSDQIDERKYDNACDSDDGVEVIGSDASNNSDESSKHEVNRISADIRRTKYSSTSFPKNSSIVETVQDVTVPQMFGSVDFKDADGSEEDVTKKRTMGLASDDKPEDETTSDDNGEPQVTTVNVNETFDKVDDDECPLQQIIDKQVGMDLKHDDTTVDVQLASTESQIKIGVYSRVRETNPILEVKTMTGDCSHGEEAEHLSEEKELNAEREHITLLISSVPTGLEEVLEMYLTSPRKSGGKLKLFKYNKRKGTAEVVFEESRVAKHFLNQKVLKVQGVEVAVAVKAESSDSSDDEEAENISRSIIVQGVSPDDEDLVLAALESSKKNGGLIDSSSYDKSTETVNVCFVDKEVAERFRTQGHLTLSDVNYVICSPLQSMTGKSFERWKKKTIMIQSVPERLLESLIILLESRKKGGGPVQEHKRDDCSGLVTVTFAEKSVAQHFVKQGVISLARQSFLIFTFTEAFLAQSTRPIEMTASCSSLQFGTLTDCSINSDVTILGEDEQTAGEVEVQNIPNEATDETLSVLFESQRVTGIPDAQVSKVSFFPRDRSRAIVSFHDNRGLLNPAASCEGAYYAKNVAERLIEKEYVEFKGHKYFIRVATVMPAFDEDVRNNDDQTDPSTNDKDSSDVLSADIEVHEIPIDCGKEKLRMILENKRYTEVTNAEVINVQFFEDNPSRAVVTFSSPAVAEQLLIKETIQFKNKVLYIKKPLSMEENGFVIVPGNTTKDKTSIEVRRIPCDCTEEKLVMIFESKRCTGVVDAKVESVTFKKNDNSRAVIKFSSSEVAEQFKEKDYVEYKGHQYWIATVLPNDKEDEEVVPSNADDIEPAFHVDDKSHVVLSAAIEVYEIPNDCGEEKLRAILENKRYTDVTGAEVINVQFVEGNPSRAVVTFSSTEVAEKLLMKKTIQFKDHLFFFRKLTEEKDNPTKPDITVEDACSIEVSDIPADCNGEKLIMIFESKRCTDLADVKVSRVMFREGDHSRAIITFSSSEDAASILAKEVVKFKGHEYRVSKPTLTQRNSCSSNISASETDSKSSEDFMATVRKPSGDSCLASHACEVHNIPPDCTEEKLTMIFESKRFTGVTDAKVVSIEFMDKNCSCAIVEFSSPEVVAKMIAVGEVIFKEQIYRVKPLSSHNEAVKQPIVEHDENNSNQRVSGGGDGVKMNAVQVNGIPGDMSRDILTMLFENVKRTGGGDIEKIDFNPGSAFAVIAFKEAQVADRLLAQRTVKYNDYMFRITTVRNNSDASTCASSPPPCETSYITTDTSQRSNTIKVCNIPATVTKEVLVMYFENAKRCGGGEVKEITINSQKGKAFITFKDVKAAEKVCEKLHCLSEAELTVTALESSIDVEVCAVEVAGILKQWTDDFLSLFFENAKRSGGGPIEEIIIDREQQVAVITFESDEVARRVLSRCPHTLDGETVRVSRLQPAPPPPTFLDSEVDWNRLLAKRLPIGTIIDDFQKFFKRVECVNIVNMTLGKKPSIALLDLDRAPDYMALRRLVSSRPFKGKMISVQRVPRTRSILVLGVPDEMKDEYIGLYFESKRANGGDIAELSRNEAGVIVTFKTHEVIGQVLKTRHSLGDQQVRVQPYYKWLGLPQPEHKEPTSVTVPFPELAVIEFVRDTASVRMEIEERLAAEKCLICWPKSRGQTLELKFKKEDGKPGPNKGWSSECAVLMTEYLNNFARGKVNVLQEIWIDFMKQMQEKIGVNHCQIRHHFDNDFCNLHYVGKLVNCTAFRKVADEIKASLEQKLQLQKSQISETLTNLKPHQLILMKDSGYVEELKSKYKDLEVQITSNELYLHAAQEVISQAKLEILEKCTNMSTDYFSVSVAIAGLMKKDMVRRHVLKILQQKRIVASFDVQSQDIHVLAWSSDHVRRAVETIRSQGVERELPLGRVSKDFLSQPQWTAFVQKLTDVDKLCFVQTKSENVLVVATTDGGIEDVVNSISEFIGNHSLVVKEVEMLRPVSSLIERCLRSDVDQLRSKLSSRGGKVELFHEANKSGFRITAVQSDVAGAERDLQKLAEVIIPYDLNIDRPGIPTYLLGAQGQNLLCGLQHKHRAAIELGDLEEIKGAVGGGFNPDAVKLRTLVTDDRLICLVLADITKCPADALIIPNDLRLDCKEGLSFEVAEAAGNDVVAECRKYIKFNDDLLAGHVFVSKAGRLPNEYIIHTYTTKWRVNQADNEDIENLMFVAITNAINSAIEKGMKSVAIPAKFAEHFRFPPDKAVRIIVNCVETGLKEAGRASLKEVFIVDSSPTELEKFKGALNAIKPLKASTSDESESSAGGRRIAKRDEGGVEGIPAERVKPDAAAPCFSASSKTGVLRTPEGIEVTLFKGAITALQVDGLVNTTSKDLNLSNGAVSKSIFTAAGPQIQDECRKVAPSSFTYGDVIETKGYSLKVKSVFHGACVAWDNDGGKCEMVMRKLLQNILRLAHNGRLASLAMPAIGTGNLRIPPPFVSSVMYDEMLKFSRSCPSTTLKDIRIVVYDKDQPTIMAFEDKIKDLLKGAPPFVSTKVSAGTSGAASASPRSGSVEASGSPSNLLDKVSFDQTTKTLSAGSIKMVIKEGDITKESADAIVNSTDDRLTMHGEVAKALLKVGGDAFAQECKKAAMGRNGLCVTTGGQLPAKFVLHLAASHSPSGWKSVIRNCLQEAEQRKWASITLPVLGTGNKSLTTTDAANVMVESFIELANKSPTSLKVVTVCIFQSSMVKEFADAVARKTSRGYLQMATGPTPFPGFNIRQTSRNGNCLFEAIADQLGRPMSESMACRLEIVEFIQCNISFMTSYQDAVFEEYGGIDEYLKFMSKDNTWGDGIVIEAASLLYRRPVRVILSGNTSPMEAASIALADSLPMLLGYMSTAKHAERTPERNHYVSLRVAGDVPSFDSTRVSADLRESPASSDAVSTAVDWLFAASSTNSSDASPSHRPPGASEQSEGRVGGSAKPHHSCIVVHIYALSQLDIDAVIKAIEEIIREYLQDQVFDSKKDQELIAKLTDEQVARIKALEVKLQARITVERGDRLNRIRVQGPPRNTMLASEQVRIILQEVITSKHKEVIGKLAQWEYVDNGNYEPYPDEINVIIENAYRDQRSMAEWEEQDARFRLIFKSMTEETVGGQAPTVKVRRVTKEVDVPSHWTPMTSAEKFKLVLLDPSSTEYSTVDKDVTATAGKTVQRIVKIQRVQNPLLYKQYVLRKLDMDRSNPGRQNERKLWHGTTEDTLNSINDSGFNRSFCGKNATMYGRGVYFARDFSYSASPTYTPPDANGLKYIFQCLALTGDFAQGAPTMVVPPPKPGGGKYDSTVDDPLNPSIFVIFNDTQVHPQYLITFQGQ